MLKKKIDSIFFRYMKYCLVNLLISLDELGFPTEIIKASIKVRTFINEYIPLLTCRFVLIEIDGNQRFLELSCILNQMGSTVKIQKETTRVHVL